MRKCNEQTHGSDDSADALSLTNVGGVFYVLSSGIGIALGLAVLEFLWNVRNVSVEEHVSTNNYKTLLKNMRQS